MTHIRHIDPELVNRYLSGRLSRAQAEAFDAQLVHDTALLREMEATARLKLGLLKLRSTGQLDALIRSPAPRARALPQAHWLMAGTAAAAMLLLSVNAFRVHGGIASAIPGMLASVADRPGQPLTSQPLKIVRTYALFRTRGGAYDATIELPGKEQAFELRVMPDSGGQNALYRISLSRTDDVVGNSPIVFGDLRPAADGFVSAVLDASRVRAGDYIVQIEDTTSTTVSPETFTIRLTSVGR